MEFFGVNVSGMISSVVEIVEIVFLIVVLVVVLGGISWMVYFFLQFKHKIRIKTRTGSKKITDDKKFRVVDRKNGEHWWQVWGTWKWFPPAPSDCIDITKKGRMSVEMHYTEDGAYYWRREDVNNDDYKRLGLGLVRERKMLFFGRKLFREVVDKGRYYYILNDGVPLKSKEEFDNLQRGMLAEQFRKAEDRKKKNWLLDNAPALAAAMFLIIMAAIFVFGGEEIWKPVLEAQKMYTDMNVRIAAIEKDAGNCAAGIQAIMPLNESASQTIGGAG